MKKIIIEDKNLNKVIYYKEAIDVDIFIERFLGAVEDPDSYIITTLDMSKDQIEALKFLYESDWYIIRKSDPSSGVDVPEDIVIARGEARELL